MHEPYPIPTPTDGTLYYVGYQLLTVQLTQLTSAFIQCDPFLNLVDSAVVLKTDFWHPKRKWLKPKTAAKFQNPHYQIVGATMKETCLDKSPFRH